MTNEAVRKQLNEFAQESLIKLNNIRIVTHCGTMWPDENSQCGKCKYLINKGCIVQDIERKLSELLYISKEEYVVCFQIHEGNHFDPVKKPPIYGPDTKENCERIAKDLKNVIIFRVIEQ
jgi:hypothetical protein